jgi:hypothetical protein
VLYDRARFVYVAQNIVLFLRLIHLASKHTYLASIQKVKELQVGTVCLADQHPLFVLTAFFRHTTRYNALVADKIFVQTKTRDWGTDAVTSP